MSALDVGTWQYISVQNNATNAVAAQGDGPATPSNFNNKFPIPVKFGRNRVQVAVTQIAYTLSTFSGRDLYITTDIVGTNQIIGNDLTNSIRLLYLENTADPSLWEPLHLQWVDVTPGDNTMSQIGIVFSDVGLGKISPFLLGPTIVTLAFRTVGGAKVN
jgi:hypothetical protein